MSLYTVLLSVHVVVAMLGAGQLAALAVLSHRVASAQLSPLLRNARIALAILLTTGIALDVRAGGVWHEHVWFRGSAVLLVCTALLSAFAQRALRQQRVATVQRSAWTMCTAIAVITALMEWKP